MVDSVGLPKSCSQLQKISDANASSTVFWQATGMSPFGQVTQETLGNGVVAHRGIDAATGLLSSLTSGPAANPAYLQNDSYLYDAAGNVTQRQSTNVGLNESFYYDGVNRLDHSLQGAAQNLKLTYDPSGNISSRTDVAGGAAWRYDPSHIHDRSRSSWISSGRSRLCNIVSIDTACCFLPL